MAGHFMSMACLIGMSAANLSIDQQLTILDVHGLQIILPFYDALTRKHRFSWKLEQVNK